MKQKLPILIAGGGIGGLATALALSKLGLRSHVLEQAGDFSEVGAGIQLGANVFKLLDWLDMRAAIDAVAFFPDNLVMRDSLTGEDLVRLPVGSAPFRERFKYPHSVVYRPDLMNVLLDACKRSALIELSTDRKLLDFDDDGDTVTVTTSANEKFRGGALIGADGIWSAVRQKIVADGPPRVSGHIAYRAVLPMAEIPESLRTNSVVLWSGPKRHFVHYPLRRGELFNLVAIFHSDRYHEGWDVYGDPVELMQRYDTAVPEVKALLGKIDTWKMWVLCDREPIKEWSKGRVTLLGDAAHPMLQYLAQGGCMAIEDAVVLAKQIAEHGDDYPAALLAYQDARYLRTARVQLTARFYGEIYHAEGVKAEVRNQMFRANPPTLESMAWLYDGI